MEFEKIYSSNLSKPEVEEYQSIADQIWIQKYQYTTAVSVVEHTSDDTFNRVLNGVLSVERFPDTDSFRSLMSYALKSKRVIPAGRILSGCGTRRDVTLSNTFVMRSIEDSVEGIMDTAKDAALTMKMGGGIGFDFSTLRPNGFVVNGLDCPAAGPLAAMDIFDSVCRMLVTGMGRGAMMATMRCDHPDIEAFVAAKADRNRMRNFNMSVLVSDAFMSALHNEEEWDLKWDGQIVRSLPATDLWNAIMQQTYDAAEPGVLFIDQINAKNPLNYLETISATNSCAEQPLPPNGTCPLASINLAKLVVAPFTEAARFDIAELRRSVALAVRLLDNVLDVSKFALPEQKEEAQSKRRIGVGVTGVADAMAMLGTQYGSQKAVFLIGSWMQTVQNAAYYASAKLAQERGAFPLYDATKHLAQPAIAALDPDVQDIVRRYGLRNGTLTTIAPTGTISMFAGNVSSGIEPIFATSYNRVITRANGIKETETVMDYAVWKFHQIFGPDVPLPESFVTANDLSPLEHVAMQAAAQKWVDSGISKTVNCAEDIAFDDFKNVYLEAYERGCKGCTTYRPNDITGAVLST